MSAPLWFDNLAAYSIQIALVTLAGAGLAAALRLRAPRVALAYWQGLLAACLALPLVEPWAQTVLAVAHDTGGVEIEFGALRNAPVHNRFPTYEIIALGLGLGVAFRLGRMALGLWRLRRYSLGARAWEPAPPMVNEFCSRLGVAPPLLLSDEIAGPMAMGNFRPAVLFPARFTQMDAECQRAIVCHELIHVSRGHWFFNLAEEMVLSIFWFHPALAWVVGRIRLAREQWVDGEVLQITGARQPYLRALVEIAAGGGWPAAVPAPEFMRENQLTQRVALMMKETSMSKPRLILSLSIALAIIFMTAAAAVHAFPLRAQPAQAAAPAAQAEPVVEVDQNEETAAPVEEPVEVKASVEKGGRRLPKLVPVHKVNPVYPPLAKLAKIEGIVEMEIRVEKNGDVSEVKVESGHPLLAKAAQEAVRQWKYAPQAHTVESTVKVNFTLAKEPADAEKLAEMKAKLAESQSETGKLADEQVAEKIAQLRAEIENQEAVIEQGQMTDEKELALARLRAQEAELAAKAKESHLAEHQAISADQKMIREAMLTAQLGEGDQSNRVQRQEMQLALMKAQKQDLENRIAGVERSIQAAKSGSGINFSPKPVKTVAPIYPAEAKAAHIQGVVVLRVTLDENGAVTDVEAESGPPALVKAAIDAVRQWQFSNPSQAPVTTTVTINFTLADSTPKPSPAPKVSPK
jgi:TonB family protein